MMYMHIPDLADYPAPAFYWSDYIQSRMCARYAVYPIVATNAQDRFIGTDGAIHRAQYYLFSYVCADHDPLPRLAEAMISDLLAAWAPGAFVVWRHLPNFCAGEGHMSLQARIGSFSPPPALTDGARGLHRIIGRAQE